MSKTKKHYRSKCHTFGEGALAEKCLPGISVHKDTILRLNKKRNSFL